MKERRELYIKNIRSPTVNEGVLKASTPSFTVGLLMDSSNRFFLESVQDKIDMAV